MKSSFRRTCFLALGTLLFATTAIAANQHAANTFVDDHGVLRWSNSGAEVALFGVNYTAPFAFSFRAHRQLGIPIERAIDADVYHFARLGFDAYRVHVWDREISDGDGNLLVNEHVRALDYLIAKLEERGIKILLTPLQFGDAGYPERGVPLPGFSAKYGKRGCLEDRISWPLQERYLAQFLNHVNTRTGVAYKDDPAIVAFEICNEPGHTDYAAAVAYIDTMVHAMRSTGCAKPIFYNMSHGLPVHEAYLDAEVQGGTFQWYPSGLVAGHEQRGNFLRYVDEYPIPFAHEAKFQRMARAVYEFDAADIGRSYLYPAFARSFRTAGFQFATQFAYDPMYLAPYNVEYQTHFLNLAYAPHKAIGMKIAGEAFRRIPRFQSFGSYPANTSFDGVRISYRDDLAELATERKFFYSNSTDTMPPTPDRLEHVAGCGSSPVVAYPGEGAYFLDRLEAGVWRLEVMPDAVWLHDPFERPSLSRRTAAIAWNRWPMKISLPDLGAKFAVSGLNEGNSAHLRANDGTIAIGPGAYLLTHAGVTSRWRADSHWGNIRLGEFVAPPASLDRIHVDHTPRTAATAGLNLVIAASVAGPQIPDAVEVVAYPPEDAAALEARLRAEQNGQPGRGNQPGTGGPVDRSLHVPMTHVAGFRYVATIPGDRLHVGRLRYHIVVRTGDRVRTFPADVAGRPSDWSFSGQPWITSIVPADEPLLLFDAERDLGQITADQRDRRYDLVPSERPGLSAMAFTALDLDQPEHDDSFRFFCKDRIAGRAERLGSATKLVVYGRSASDRPCPVQVALVTEDGLAYGGIVELPPHFTAGEIPLAALKQVRSPNIPHGYPVFIPFWSPAGPPTPLDLHKVESVLVSIGPSVPAAEYTQPHRIDLERVWLE